MSIDTVPKDKKFTVGRIIIVVFSIMIGLLHVGILYMFGLPLLGLLAGIVLVWLARTSIKLKILWTLAPLPIAISLFLAFLYMNRTDPEVFLIPSNFRGQFVVFFNEPCGVTPASEGNKRIYNIPENGILITNSNRLVGVLNRRFYFVDKLGNRIEIPEFDSSDFEEESSYWRWHLSSQRPTRDTIGVFWAYSKEVSFIVSTFQSPEIDKSSWSANRKVFGDRANAELDRCRKLQNR